MENKPFTAKEEQETLEKIFGKNPLDKAFTAEDALEITRKARNKEIDPDYVTENKEAIKQEILKTIKSLSSGGYNGINFSCEHLLRSTQGSSRKLEQYFMRRSYATWGGDDPFLMPFSTADEAPASVKFKKMAFTYLKNELTSWLSELGFCHFIGSGGAEYVLWITDKQKEKLADIREYDKQMKEIQSRQLALDPKYLQDSYHELDDKISKIKYLRKSDPERSILSSMEFEKNEMINSLTRIRNEIGDLQIQKDTILRQKRDLEKEFWDTIKVPGDYH